jgi:hypothetical protein
MRFLSGLFVLALMLSTSTICIGTDSAFAPPSHGSTEVRGAGQYDAPAGLQARRRSPSKRRPLTFSSTELAA